MCVHFDLQQRLCLALAGLLPACLPGQGPSTVLPRPFAFLFRLTIPVLHAGFHVSHAAQD